MGFKDLMKSFLYENVEDDEDDEEEEVSPKPAASSTPARPAASVSRPAPSSPSAPSYGQQVSLEAYYTQPQLTPSARSSSAGSFLEGLEADPPVSEPEEQPEPSVPKAVRTRPARTGGKNSAVRPNYSSVISPIFGNLPEEEKDPKALHDAINLPKPVDSSDMVEIISPMFGTASAARAPQPNPPRFLQESRPFGSGRSLKKQAADLLAAEAKNKNRTKKAAPSKSSQETGLSGYDEQELEASLSVDPMGLRAVQSQAALKKEELSSSEEEPVQKAELPEEQTSSPLEPEEKTSSPTQEEEETEAETGVSRSSGQNGRSSGQSQRKTLGPGADLSTYLSRGPNPNKSNRNHSKSKKGGRSR